MTNTLVLARMMREGRFDADSAFRTPDGRGVFAGPSESVDYFGISLGGINGTVFATGGGYEPFEIPDGAAQPCDPR